jgi:hypothetical protein
MNEEQAKEILKDIIRNDNSLNAPYIDWSPDAYLNEITLDGDFSADQLEAMSWWMRNKAK